MVLFYWDVCACVFLRTGTLQDFFLSTSTDGCQGWSRGAEEDEGRSLHEGSVSMVTPPPAHRYKKSPPSTIVRLLARWRGVEGWSREGEWSREQEDGL